MADNHRIATDVNILAGEHAHKLATIAVVGMVGKRRRSFWGRISGSHNALQGCFV